MTNPYLVLLLAGGAAALRDRAAAVRVVRFGHGWAGVDRLKGPTGSGGAAR